MSEFVPGLIWKPTDRRKILGLRLPAADLVVPVRIDERPRLLSSSDQGATSECVAYAVAGWLEFYRWKNHGNAAQVDPDPIYKRAKEIDGAPNEPGTTLEAGIQAAQDLKLMSPVEAGSLHSVSEVGEVMAALHRYGVVLAGMKVYGGWEHSQMDGLILTGGEFLGYHAVVLCYYDSTEPIKQFGFQNSWGASQGWRGFNRMDEPTFVDSFDYGLVWDFACPA